MQALVPYKRDPGLFDQGPFSYQCYQRCKGSCGIGGVFLRDRSCSPMARIALAKSHSELSARLPLQLPLSVILPERSEWRNLLPSSSAAISFQAATGGAPFGCASLRPLPESTASSLRDNLYLPGPSPCPLRGWICPPCGSLKALHRSATPS